MTSGAAVAHPASSAAGARSSRWEEDAITAHRGVRSRAIAAVVAWLVVAPLAASCQSSPPWQLADCSPAASDGRSVARVWNESTLALIRQVVPAPTVHARNLYHLSAAMWDAWAAYDASADGLFVTEKAAPEAAEADRPTAIAFAAYRVLRWRYGEVADLATAGPALEATMRSLCLRPDFVSTDGPSPAALGNRIAAAVIEAGTADGALEEVRYQDSAYVPVNDPLVVAEAGASMRDPDRWQPLALDEQLSQNGLPIPGQVQAFIGSHWGRVTAFALPRSEAGTPIDPGPPPRLGDPATEAAFRQAALDVLRYGAQLDPSDGVEVDIGPGALGGNSLGTNDGRGHATNPGTGRPYAPNRVLRADFARVLAEFWADGPESETPPGHWNLIANEVSDRLAERRIGGRGEPVDRLEWDVKLYLALNGAVHDAAIAAWGLKGHYDSVRPISMIRFLGANGQSSDPAGLSYHPRGLPLEPGLVEVITAASSAPGERHAHLAAHAGEIAVRSWLGSPDDPRTQTSGVGWIRAVEWLPYQRPTFVTPAFAGYVSGHSTFSRAAAEVLSAFTGSEYFPGGIATWTVAQGSLLHEEGPTRDVDLQWATYADAADQAGLSRLYGGIHIPADDLEGRRIGAICGRDAWARAQRYFDGTAVPG